MAGFIQDFKIRRQVKKNAQAEAEKIYDKLDKKGQYSESGYIDQNKGRKRRFYEKPLATGGSAEEAKANSKRKAGVKAMRKQVVKTRQKQYNDNQKRIAEQMGVKL